MRIAIGADHAGFQLKEALIKGVLAPYEVLDLGTHSPHEPVDYPEYAFAVAEAVAEERAEYGILVCGTGIGMAMAAARIPGIRAATCTNVFMARMARATTTPTYYALGVGSSGLGWRRRSCVSSLPPRSRAGVTPVVWRSSLEDPKGGGDGDGIGGNPQQTPR